MTGAPADLDVDLARMLRVLRSGLKPARPVLPVRFGPGGVAVRLKTDRGTVAGSVIVTQAPFAEAGQPETPWIHASISWNKRMPGYHDLCVLRDAVFGPARESYQVFPPPRDHVNIHPRALHLWGRADGTRVLPEFGEHGTI